MRIGHNPLLLDLGTAFEESPFRQVNKLDRTSNDCLQALANESIYERVKTPDDPWGKKMKNSLLLSTFATVFAFASLVHADPNVMPLHDPTQTAVAFDTIYAPVGFDSNDNVQIVGEGLFENACYRPATPLFTVDQVKKTIDVTPMAYKYSGFCLQLSLPFDRVLDLGIMKEGNYTITQNGATIGSIPIRVATTSNPDDYLYAPVSQAYFHQSADGTSRILLSGDFPSTCMKMQKVVVHVQTNVITVQPIAELDGGRNCLNKRTPFEQSVKVENAPKGRYLLHIRSMNAKAVNTLVDIN